MSPRRLCLVTCFAVLSWAEGALASPPSALEKANARRLFNEGLDLRRADDHAGALAKLAAADALFATPKTRLELGREQLANGKLVEAHASLLSVANVAAPAGEEPKYVATRAEAARLVSEVFPRIPTLRFVGPSSPTLIVEVDALAVPHAALAEPRMLNPGDHVVVLKREGAPDRVVMLTLREGESSALMLVDARAPLPAPAREPAQPTSRPPISVPPHRAALPATRSSSWSAQRTVAVAVAGASAVAFGVTGYLALSARATFDDSAPHCPGPGNACGPTGVALREDALAKANAATFIGAAGVAGAALAGVLWFTAPRGSTSVGVASNGVVVGGTFP